MRITSGSSVFTQPGSPAVLRAAEGLVCLPLRADLDGARRWAARCQEETCKLEVPGALLTPSNLDLGAIICLAN
jgi:hypothetical protein